MSGSKNKGFWNSLLRIKEAVAMACKENDFDSEILKKISGEFGKKLSRAIRFSPPEDTAGMQRLAAGLNALSKSLAVIQKFETEGAVPIRNYSPYLEVDDD